ncbi:hypothetical protein CLUG_05813 [Clavispora lusitaniae ATCC 42720]|uniref:Uncharacterized protein n=1 Tax=Clavispora lusitaniae (strain ATCC 42720) TaxID=306902 RepID=C4YCH4_CLAL4|nr:uncharacterized protein CLUG_05813 [Clavispora lusitaniae ATCC 42720]EEQ41685.1 hypothetical protein CLUG_05813 [Clavispora lusitaniae ATCC 42720]
MTVLQTPYSKETLAPKPSKVALILSASSLATFSFNTLGAASTNFLDSTKDKPNKLLTSLMILGLALASKDSNLMEKIVFSSTTSCTSSSTGAAGAAGPAPAAGSAMSEMFNSVFNSVINAEVSNKVNVEIWSTICEILGSTGAFSAATALKRTHARKFCSARASATGSTDWRNIGVEG